MTAHPLSDKMIAEYWPSASTDEDRAELRNQFDALLRQLRLVWHRSFPRHHELFAEISASKAADLPSRIAALRAALDGLPEHWRQWQWKADEKPVFGERYVRSVYGDNGHGMGRQAIAVVPADRHYFGTLADFIAAANPDTITMLLAAYGSTVTQKSEGVEAIAAERRRQIEVEGWTPEHDDAHDKGEMAIAAAAYLLNTDELRDVMPANWPWSLKWWKPKGRIRDLERAGTLIAAEIDRLKRKEKALEQISS